MRILILTKAKNTDNTNNTNNMNAAVQKYCAERHRLQVSGPSLARASAPSAARSLAGKQTGQGTSGDVMSESRRTVHSRTSARCNPGAEGTR